MGISAYFFAEGEFETLRSRKKHRPRCSFVIENSALMRDQGLEPWTP